MKKNKDSCWCDKLHPAFFAIGRIVFGLLFFLHGAAKFGVGSEMNIQGFAAAFGFPFWLALVVAVVEVLAGLFILFGFWTKYASGAGFVIMLTAYLIAHAPQGANPLANGGELALLYAAAFLLLHAHGPGIWSIANAGRK